MDKMKNLLIVLIVVALSGCVTAKLGKEVVYANEEFKSGNVQETLTSIDYTVAEEQVITHALNKVSAFRDKYGKFIADPDMLLSVKLVELNEDFNGLKESYLQVEDIVESNWDQYPDEVKDTLQEYGQHAYELNKAVDKFSKVGEYRQMIRSALKYGFTTLQLVVALKP